MTDQPYPEPRESSWRRLDPRMLVLNLSVLVAPAAAFLGTLVVTGGDIPEGALFGTLLPVCGGFVVIVGVGLIRYATTRYLVGNERVEMRSGLLFRRHLSIPRDRIRSVDLTANPLHRVFGLSVVKVGTGQTGGPTETNELSLNAVTRAHADELRRELLSRPTSTPDPGVETSPAEAAATPATRAIAVLDWRWVRYAPLSGWTLFFGVMLLGVAQRVLEAIGLNPFQTGLVNDVIGWLAQYSLGLVIAVGVVVMLAVGVVGATAIYVENWWGFSLTRDATDVFRVRRGLLTTRSFSLEERRLRGVEVVEPLTMRWAGGATAKAVATGLATSHKDQQKKKDALMPPAPLTTAHRITAEVLAEERTPVAVTDLRGHPRAALRRRLFRAAVPPAALVVLLAAGSVWFGWLPTWIVPLPLALLVGTIPLAFDAYRNLGHTLTGRYLVTRYGTIFRRTVGLRRDGVIGWTISRSYFQRRAGLATVAATTGAGGGAYLIRDVDSGDGLAFAADAVPDLLTEFIER